MQSIPVDVAKIVFLAMSAPRPTLKDRRTGEVATDREGRTVTALRCACVPRDESSEDIPEMELIQTVAEVPPIRRGTQVQVTGLVARPYAFKDNSGAQRAGVTFWADAIGPVGAPSKASSS